jgi:hypothetical protein
MRGGDERSGSLFSYVDLEARVGTFAAAAYNLARLPKLLDVVRHGFETPGCACSGGQG